MLPARPSLLYHLVQRGIPVMNIQYQRNVLLVFINLDAVNGRAFRALLDRISH